MFLLIYYVSVSVLTIYWVVVFNRTASNADGINTWYWAADSVALISVGVVSDRLRVRKPFMVIGAVGTIAMTLVLIYQTGHGTTTGTTRTSSWSVLLGTFHRHRLHALDGRVHRSGRGAQPGAVGDRVWRSGAGCCGSSWRSRSSCSHRVITTATTLTDHYSAGTELQAFQSAQPYAPSLTLGAKTPAPAPASVITQLQSVKQPATDAFAQILRNVRAYSSDEPCRAPGVRRRAAVRSVDGSRRRRRRPLLPANVIPALNATGQKGPQASAVILQNYATTHSLSGPPVGDPASLGGLRGGGCPSGVPAPRLGRSKTASRSRARRFRPVDDPNLQQVLDRRVAPRATRAPKRRLSCCVSSLSPRWCRRAGM